MLSKGLIDDLNENIGESEKCIKFTKEKTTLFWFYITMVMKVLYMLIKQRLLNLNALKV